MSWLECLPKQSLAVLNRSLKQVLKVPQNGRCFSTEKSLLTERKAYVYSPFLNIGISDSAKRDELILIKMFRKYTPDVEILTPKNFETVVKTEKKATLVISGCSIMNLKPVLSGYVSTIREKVKSGELNCLGLGAGAIMVGYGYNSRILSSPDENTLRLGNFWSGTLPIRYAPDIERGWNLQTRSLHVNGETGLYKVNSLTSDSVLEPFQNQSKEPSSTLKTWEYVDSLSNKVLGVAELNGTYGKGRFHAITHRSTNEYVLVEKEIDKVAEQLRNASLDAAVRNVLDIDPPNPNK